MSKFSGPEVRFLVTSAGRRGELVQILQETVRLNGTGGAVFTVDRSPLTSAGWLSDGLDLVPLVADSGYVDALLDVCERRGVTHLVPTIDTELGVLAANKDRFRARGVDAWVSEPGAVAIARDKRLTNSWLSGNSFPTVDQFDLADVPLGVAERVGLIAKPASGSSSVGLCRVSSVAELASLDKELDYIVETVAEGDEFTVDVLVDRTGRCRAAVPRQRLETRAGEVSKGRTVDAPDVISLAMEIAEALPGAYGVLNLQMFRSEPGVIKVIEINARFGGGFPLSWNAGCQMPLWLVQAGSTDDPTADLSWLSDQVMLRYDRGVYLDCRS